MQGRFMVIQSSLCCLSSYWDIFGEVGNSYDLFGNMSWFPSIHLLLGGAFDPCLWRTSMEGSQTSICHQLGAWFWSREVLHGDNTHMDTATQFPSLPWTIGSLSLSWIHFTKKKRSLSWIVCDGVILQNWSSYSFDGADWQQSFISPGPGYSSIGPLAMHLIRDNHCDEKWNPGSNLPVANAY